ncbi:MAG: 6-bladed beta-propeller [Bacteroidota bacterium]
MFTRFWGRISLVLCCLILSLACSKQDTSYPKGSKIKIDVLKQEYSPTSFIESVEYIPLESDSNNFLIGISKIIPFEDRFYIMDELQTKIMAFDTTGKYLFLLKALGKGPGEFGELGDFLIDKVDREIEVMDRYGKVIRYDLDGLFLEERRTEFICEEFSKLPGGGYACNSGSDNFYEGKAVKGNLLILSEKLELQKDLLQPIGLQEMIVGDKGRLTPIEGRGLMMYWLFPTIFEVSEKGIPKPLYTLDFGAHNPPEEWLYHYSFEEMERDDDLLSESNYAHEFFQLVETPKYLSCVFFLQKEKKQVLIEKESLKNKLMPAFMVDREVYTYPISTFGKYVLGSVSGLELLETVAIDRASPALSRLMEKTKDNQGHGNPILVKMKYASDIFVKEDE